MENVINQQKIHNKDFQIVKELGKGGFGSVYLVKVNELVK
jgi:hypothetical protein